MAAAIELGQVGFAGRRISPAETRPSAFAHVNSASGAAGDALVAALRRGADGRDLDVRRATGAPNPDGGGHLLPPSSLFSLARRTPSVPGVVLAEHDGAYVDPFHGGAFDVGLAAVDVDRMARLAATLAAALPRIAREGDAGRGGETETAAETAAADAVASFVSDDAVRDAVERLTACLIDPSVGFECATARRLLTTSETFPSRYAGVVAAPSTEHAGPSGKNDVARFAWEYLVDVLATRDETDETVRGARCVTSAQCDVENGEVCSRGTAREEEDEEEEEDERVDESESSSRTRTGSRSSRRRGLLGSSRGGEDGANVATGACVRASARYVPAWSRRLAWTPRDGWSVRDPDEYDASLPGGEDPVWAESDWPSSVGARGYAREGFARELVVFVVGVVTTAASYLLSRRFDALLEERFKDE